VNRMSRVAFQIILALHMAAGILLGQTDANDVRLFGQGLVLDDVMPNGVAVLHHLIGGELASLDSVPIMEDGTFQFDLPNPPDPDRRDIYFGSIRHEGVLYFGPPITQMGDLEAIYTIQAYDTLVASPIGIELPIEIRNLFLEFGGDRWRVTDLIEVYNDSSRTLVSADSGFVWSYPLIPGATEFELGQTEMSPESITLEAGELRVRSPIPPGRRLFVVSYMIDEPYVSIPMPGSTSVVELLVREPAPLIHVQGLDSVARIELEPGTTYRRYSGINLSTPDVRLSEVKTPFELPVAALSLILGIFLVVAGFFLLNQRTITSTSLKSKSKRSTGISLIHQVAILDENFAVQKSPVTQEEEDRYRKERAELVKLISRNS